MDIFLSKTVSILSFSILQIFASDTEPLEFRHPIYQLKVPEDIRPGGRVFRLKMARARQSDVDVANLTYHMMFPVDWFAVNSSTVSRSWFALAANFICSIIFFNMSQRMMQYHLVSKNDATPFGPCAGHF